MSIDFSEDSTKECAEKFVEILRNSKNDARLSAPPRCKYFTDNMMTLAHLGAIYDALFDFDTLRTNTNNNFSFAPTSDAEFRLCTKTVIPFLLLQMITQPHQQSRELLALFTQRLAQQPDSVADHSYQPGYFPLLGVRTFDRHSEFHNAFDAFVYSSALSRVLPMESQEIITAVWEMAHGMSKESKAMVLYALTPWFANYDYISHEFEHDTERRDSVLEALYIVTVEFLSEENTHSESLLQYVWQACIGSGKESTTNSVVAFLLKKTSGGGAANDSASGKGALEVVRRIAIFCCRSDADDDVHCTPSTAKCRFIGSLMSYLRHYEPYPASDATYMERLLTGDYITNQKEGALIEKRALQVITEVLYEHPELFSASQIAQLLLNTLLLFLQPEKDVPIPDAALVIANTLRAVSLHAVDTDVTARASKLIEKANRVYEIIKLKKTEQHKSKMIITQLEKEREHAAPSELAGYNQRIVEAKEHFGRTLFWFGNDVEEMLPLLDAVYEGFTGLFSRMLFTWAINLFDISSAVEAMQLYATISTRCDGESLERVTFGMLKFIAYVQEDAMVVLCDNIKDLIAQTTNHEMLLRVFKLLCCALSVTNVAQFSAVVDAFTACVDKVIDEGDRVDEFAKEFAIVFGYDKTVLQPLICCLSATSLEVQAFRLLMAVLRLMVDDTAKRPKKHRIDFASLLRVDSGEDDGSDSDDGRITNAMVRFFVPLYSASWVLLFLFFASGNKLVYDTFSSYYPQVKAGFPRSFLDFLDDVYSNANTAATRFADKVNKLAELVGTYIPSVSSGFIELIVAVAQHATGRLAASALLSLNEVFTSKMLLEQFGVSNMIQSKYCLTVSKSVMSPNQEVRNAAHHALPFVLSCCNPRKLFGDGVEAEKAEVPTFFSKDLDGGSASGLEAVKRIVKFTLSTEASSVNAVTSASAKTVKSLSVNNRAAQLERAALLDPESPETTPSARLRSFYAKFPYAQHNSSAGWYTPFSDVLLCPTGGPVPHIVEK